MNYNLKTVSYYCHNSLSLHPLTYLSLMAVLAWYIAGTQEVFLKWMTWQRKSQALPGCLGDLWSPPLSWECHEDPEIST